MIMQANEGVEFHSVPAHMFPFTVYLTRVDTRQVVYRAYVDGPGSVYIPAVAAIIGVPVLARIAFADGTVVEETEEDITRDDAATPREGET